MESPSSWITRISMQQVVHPRELTQYLDLRIGRDCELLIAQKPITEVAEKISKTSGSLSAVAWVLHRLKSVDPSGERFLLRNSSGAYHRYCAACLATDSTKYFRIEWRFKCWRWCPIHGCLLYECCPHCGCHVKLPADMYVAGPHRAGIATLDRCLQCTKLLTTGWEKCLHTLVKELLSPWELMLLRNGRAALSALANGRLEIGGQGRFEDYMYLQKIDRLGLLPHLNFQLTHGQLVQRAESARY